MKKFLVLGASSDLGMAYIKKLDGTQGIEDTLVIAHYRTMSKALEDVISSAKQIRVEAIQADLQQSEDVGRLVAHIKDRFTAPTHILHLAAGKLRHMRLRQFDSEAVKAELQVQVISLGEIFKAFLPVMAKDRYGKVVVMLTSCTIGVPPKFMADYIISKYALLGLVKAASAEYCDKGLCINGLSPSMIETKFLDDIDQKIVELTAAQSPLKRNVTVDEVVSAIEFLMSDENSYMCGNNLNVSGGFIG